MATSRAITSSTSSLCVAILFSARVLQEGKFDDVTIMLVSANLFYLPEMAIQISCSESALKLKEECTLTEAFLQTELLVPHAGLSVSCIHSLGSVWSLVLHKAEPQKHRAPVV